MKAIVVGAGPAGIAAAGALHAGGCEVVLVDEGARPGGQVYRSPAPGLALDMPRLLGTADHAAYARFQAEAHALLDRIEYRPETLAWNIHGGELHLAPRQGALTALPYDALVLATGAIDRTMPMPGWTLPGVFTLGGAQALLKDQGCLIGRRVVFCGSSPLLYLAAWQYRRMGAEVAAILDTTPFRRKLGASLGMAAAAPAMMAKGLGLMAALRRAGVPIRHGVRLEGAEGQEGVEALRYRDAEGAMHRLECDGIAYGFGLRPETQLAELAGCTLRYDAGYRQYYPQMDTDGRAGQGVYLAGDGSALGGAVAAALSGKLAAAALLADAGKPAQGEVTALRGRVERLRRFQRAMAGAFAWPAAAVAALPDEVTLCRCEKITVGTVRQAIATPLGPREVNRVKAATRTGMGRCQGRFCGLASAELVQALLGSEAPPGRLRAQPPIKPLPIGASEAVGP